MKITRQQLRKLIETTIKPSIPNIPSDDSYTKIDKLSRDPEYQHMADTMADAFGYPEDRSYVEDLATYDDAGRKTFDTVNVKPLGQTESEVVTVPIPHELVDKLIKAHKEIEKLESMLPPGYPSRKYNRVPFDYFSSAGRGILQHINDHLDGKYGRDNYDIYNYGASGASGYRAEPYSKAMEKFGEYI